MSNFYVVWGIDYPVIPVIRQALDNLRREFISIFKVIFPRTFLEKVPVGSVEEQILRRHSGTLHVIRLLADHYQRQGSKVANRHSSGSIMKFYLRKPELSASWRLKQRVFCGNFNAISSELFASVRR